jgi:lysophospholipase L1-like esterase
MPSAIKMQAVSSTDGKIYTWRASFEDRSGIGFPGPGAALEVAVYSGPVGTPAPPPDPAITVTVASPAQFTGYNEGDTIVVTGTISKPGTVQVAIGASSGAATVVGLTFSYSRQLLVGDVGEPVIVATATATADGSVGASTPRSIVVTGTSITGKQAVQNSWVHDSKLFTPVGSAPNNSVTFDYQYGLFFTTTAGCTLLTLYGIRNPYALTDVYVDGVAYALPSMSGTTTAAGSCTVALPGGVHTVEIRGGLVNITAVEFNAPYYVVLPTAPTKRVVFYGDSITEGSALAGAGLAMAGTYIALLRHRGKVGKIYNLGVSGRKLLGVANTGAAQDALVAYLAPYFDGTSKNYFVLALGTNDYGIAGTGQTPTAYATALSQTLAKIHAAYPSATLFYCSPWPRAEDGSSTPNALGFLCQDYRAAGEAAATALGYVNVLAGASITPALLDGLHPNAAGNVTIANFIETPLAA